MERIGRYEILEELGRGAMGAVYKARDPLMDRTVALKVILTANLSPAELKRYKSRFYREAQAAGKMAHPGIVTIHDIAEDQAGHPYLVMEFIEGVSLDVLVERAIERGERVPLAQVLDIGMQVARALDYAHRRGVIHRDIKPANILLTQEGAAKIADFGIAKISGTQMTQTGSVLGTPAFMSPEQFRGDELDSRSDLFSLGAVLFWLCTGEKPFPGETLTTVSFKVVFGDHTPARRLNPDLPQPIETVFERCLAKNPQHRYGNGKELADDLEAVRHGRPIKATPLPPEAKVPPPPQGETVMATPGVGVPLAATMPEQAVERTVAVPPSQATVSPPAAARTIEPPAPTRRRRRKWIWAIPVAVLLLALGGYWRRSAEPVQSSTAQQSVSPEPERTAPPPTPVETPARSEPEPAPPVVEPEPEPAATPAASKGKGKGKGLRRSVPPVSGPMATLNVDCLHNFRSATLEIFSGEAQLLRTTLRGDVQDLGIMKVAQGRYRTSMQIPAGQHVLRVRVTSSRDGYDDEDQIGGRFTEGSFRTLLIEFGRGSGLRVVDRKLILRWR